MSEINDNTYSGSEVCVPSLHLPDGSMSSGYITQGWTEDKSRLSVTTYAETKAGTPQKTQSEAKPEPQKSKCCLLI